MTPLTTTATLPLTAPLTLGLTGWGAVTGGGNEDAGVWLLADDDVFLLTGDGEKILAE